MGAKTALPRGRGGRGKDCTPSGRGWQGQRLRYPWGSFLSEVYDNLPADSNITVVKKDKKPQVKLSDFFVYCVMNVTTTPF